MEIPTRAVKAVLYDTNGSVLLLQRNPLTRNGENSWDLPGGILEENETEIYGLIREAKEELGVVIRIIRPAKEWTFLRPKDNKIVSVRNYLCEFTELNPQIVLSDEHCAYKWVPLENIPLFKVKDPSFITSLNN